MDADPHEPPAWRAVASFGNQDEARLLAGRLEAEGIQARIFPDPDFSVYGRDSVAMLGQPIEVLVPEELAGRAERVIDDIRKGP